jgi:hypothetical protein
MAAWYRAYKARASAKYLSWRAGLTSVRQIVGAALPLYLLSRWNSTDDRGVFAILGRLIICSQPAPIRRSLTGGHLQPEDRTKLI